MHTESTWRASIPKEAIENEQNRNAVKMNDSNKPNLMVQVGQDDTL